MKNKIKAFLLVATLFVAMNVSVMAEGNYVIGDITFSNLKELPSDFLETKLPVKTGDSYLTGSYMCMFLVSSVILILFIIKFSNKKKGDVK